MTTGGHTDRLRAAAFAVVGLVALAAGIARGQVPLLVDGRDVGSARTDLVAGTAYAPIDRLAPALGVRWLVGTDGATIVASLGGHVVVTDVVEDPGDATVPGAVRRNGDPVGDRAAVRIDGDVWMPVAAFGRAFGAATSFVGDPATVTVVSARGTVVDVRTTTSSPDLDLATVAFDAPVRLERMPNATPGRSEWLVPRAVAATAGTTSAGRIVRFDLVPTNEGVLLRLDVVAASVEAIETASGEGTTIRFRVTPDPTAVDRTDAGGGPSSSLRDDGNTDAAIVLEARSTAVAAGAVDPVREVVTEVARRLDPGGQLARVVDTVPGPGGDAVRREASSKAAAYLVVRTADVPVGEVRLWVLGEWDEALGRDPSIVRRASSLDAATTTDEVRREIVLGLVPDLAAGMDAATRIATALFDVGGFRSGTPLSAPIVDLRAAAGRGVLLEVSLDTLQTQAFVEALSLALRDVAGAALR